MSVSKANVAWFSKGSGGLNEIYQKTGMCFSFLSSPKDGSRQCHEWVKCRDYMHDAVRTTITGKGSSVFGFQYNRASNPPVDLAKMRMLVSKYNLKTEQDVEDFKRKMRAGLIMLQHFEKHGGVALSTMKEVDPTNSNKKVVVLFTGSAIWMKSPFLVSMYSFLIRLGDKEIKFKNAADLKKQMEKMAKDFSSGQKFKGDNDVSYLRHMWKHLHTVVKERNKIFVKKDGYDETFFQNITIHNFHNQGGILSLIRHNTPNADLNKRVQTILA